MDDPLRQAAFQALGNVFETMFFVFLEPYAGEPAGPLPGTDGKWLQCSLPFRGRIQGRLRLWIPYPLACELATNFLGLETEAAEDQTVDMVKELSNMVCGNLFSIFDRQQAYLLDMPAAELVSGGPEKAGAVRPGNLQLDFLAEDRLIRLEIELGPPPAGQDG